MPTKQDLNVAETSFGTTATKEFPLVEATSRSDLNEGSVWIFGFADLANFWYGFSVFAHKNFGFPVLLSCADCGFSPI